MESKSTVEKTEVEDKYGFLSLVVIIVAFLVFQGEPSIADSLRTAVKNWAATIGK